MLFLTVSSLQCKVAGGGDLIPIRTPEYRAWVPLGEVGLNVNDSKVLVFAARSCFGAHILLQNDAADFKNSVYEVKLQHCMMLLLFHAEASCIPAMSQLLHRSQSLTRQTSEG